MINPYITELITGCIQQCPDSDQQSLSSINKYRNYLSRKYKKKVKLNAEYGDINAIDYVHLFDSAIKCQKGVLWKSSVAQYMQQLPKSTAILEAELRNGSYRPARPMKVLLTHPKKREAISIMFRDRVYQRSLNDNIIYPAMTKSFIYDNCACQKGKGTKFAKDRLVCHIQRAVRQWGLDLYVGQFDIKHYYENMQHDTTEQMFMDNLPDRYGNRVVDILSYQYKDQKGYNPGSQMVQIAGIAVLNGLDHYIKEKLHVKYYIRYMDDFIIIHRDKEFIKHCKTEIAKYISNIGLSLHDGKTKIYKITDGIRFLGFKFTPTSTTKVIKSVLGQNVRNYKRKLKKMVKLAKQGKMTKDKVDECFNSWKAHIKYGNSYKLLRRMEAYYNRLWSDCDDFYQI